MQIIQPKGFTTDTTPIFEWEAVQDVTEYNFKVTNNVTSQIVINEVVTSTMYESGAALPYGTYAIEVKAEDKDIVIDIVVITPALAEYAIVGRDGDLGYTNYKRHQSNIRQSVKQLGGVANQVLASNANLLAAIADDDGLKKFHADTIAQTPGLAADLAIVETLAGHLLEVVQRIARRDPGF